MKDCNYKSKCKYDCDKFHHELLHRKPNISHVDSASDLNSCLFPIMKVKTANPNKTVNVMLDTCASISLITEKKA